MKLLVDFNNVFSASYLGIINRMKNELFLISEIEDFARKMMLEKIFNWKELFECGNKDIILCDDFSSWRKDVYPFYKSGRKKAKSNMTVDFDEMYKFKKRFTDEINFFDFKYISTHKAEGDDVIAVLSKEINQQKVIISSDKDMIQLINDDVRLYNPIKKIIVNEYVVKSGNKEIVFEAKTKKDVKKILMMMILKGDDGDSVPNVKSDDDAFINPNKKQVSFGHGTIKKLLYDVSDQEVINNIKKIHHEFKENFKRNSTMIDLTKIPDEISRQIVTTYSQVVTICSYDYNKIVEYLNQQIFKDLYENVKYMIRKEEKNLF